MGRDILDLYSDYLLYSNGQTTATGLSKVLEDEISHDKITRFLSSEYFDGKALWMKTKKLVRAFEGKDACLIIDDTVIEKPYMDENEIICWHFDSKEGKAVKGINLISAFYSSVKAGKIIRIPIDYRIIAKTEEYIDEKSGETKRRSPETKNKMMQEMIRRHIQNNVKFRYILADSWYSSVENMRFIAKKKKIFIFELKENRKIALGVKERNIGAFERVDQAAIPEGEPARVWIKDLDFSVLLFKQVFKNKDGTLGERCLVSNDCTLTDEQFKTLYKKRWGVEEYHKSLKQNASIGSSPAHTERTQSNHIFASIYAYVKLEKLRLGTTFNHFALKTKIYMASMKTAITEFQELWKSTQNLAFA
jgi:IS4 transposase